MTALQAMAGRDLAIGRDRPRFLLFFAAATLLYALTVPGNHAEADDAFMYAFDVETKPYGSLFNPYHAAYLPLMKLLFQAARTLGYTGRPFGLMQAVSVATAAAAVALFDLVLRRGLRLPAPAAALGAALLAMSYGFWRYAGEAEVYAPASLLALGLFHAALKPRRTARDGLGLGVVASASILMHALNASLACVAVPLLLLADRRWRTLAAYGIGSAIILGAIYGFGVLAMAGDGGIGPNNAFDLRLVPFSAKTLLQGLVGFGQTILSGMFLFDLPGFAQLLGRLVPAMMLDDELFTATHAGSLPAYLGLVTATALAATALAATASLSLGSVLARASLRRPRRPEIMALLWLVAYAGVCLLLAPAQAEMWILALPPFWIVVTSVVIAPLVARGAAALVAAFVALLSTHNYVAGMGMVREARGDYYRDRTRWLLDHAGTADLILTFDKDTLARYLRYEGRADVVNLYNMSTAQLARLNRMLDERRSGSLYVMAEVLAPRGPTCRSASVGCDPLRQFSVRMQERYAVEVVDRDVVFELKPVKNGPASDGNGPT